MTPTAEQRQRYHAYNLAYEHRPERMSRTRARHSTEAYKAQHRVSYAAHRDLRLAHARQRRQTTHFKEVRRRYEHSPAQKTRKRLYQGSPAYKAKLKSSPRYRERCRARKTRRRHSNVGRLARWRENQRRKLGSALFAELEPFLLLVRAFHLSLTLKPKPAAELAVQPCN